MHVSQKITIVRMSRPSRKNINQELQWLGTSLGLFSTRDKDRSCYRIFLELLKAAKMQKSLTSDELAARSKLSRGTVVFHLNKLIQAGIIVASKNKYILRVDKLEHLIQEIRKDLQRTMDDLQDVAEDIDKWLGL